MKDIAEEHWLRDNTMSDNDREDYVKGFLACAENMYSEEDMIEYSEYQGTLSPSDWIKQYKKK